MAKLSFVLLILFCVDATAQGIAEGTLINKATGKPIPYVNIYFKSNSWRGTISNSQGNFKLRLPDRNDSIIFSHVSFKRKAFSTDFFSNSKKIYLDELEKLLSEVVIMPDSSLRQMLRKAFKQIETNYPATGTLAEGFYRETNKLTEDNEFIYFSESTIQFYKPPYNNRNYGPVKIIAGSKAEVASRSDYSNVKFYAGVYSPQRLDFVKQRMEFINPSWFRLYDYSIESIMKNGDREIINISFKPNGDSRSKAEYSGHFQLDKKTLAYISAQFELTDPGLRNHNRNVLLNIKDTRIHYDVRYRKENDVWHLVSIVYDGELYNPKYKNYLRHTCEFITTSIRSVDTNPIKEQEAIAYTSIYTDQESKFTDDYLNRSEVIAMDSVLEKQVQVLFHKKDLTLKKDSTARALLAGPTLENSSNHYIKKATRFALKTSSSISVGIVPTTAGGALWSVGYANAISTQQQIDNASYTWFLDSDFSFKLSRSFAAFISFAGQMSKTKELGIARIGFDYRKRLAGWRLPLVLHANISFGSAYLSQRVGKAMPNEDFTINNTTFKSGKNVEMLVGRRGIGVFPGLQLNYSFRPRLQIYGGVIFYSAITTHDRMLLRQKKNFLSTNTEAVNLDDPKVNLSVDGNTRQVSPIDFQGFPTMFRVGIALGID